MVLISSKKPPLAAALHDMSSFGRCALSVITPVLSALGIQVCAVPTALLSTHTGGFDGFCFVDNTDFMISSLNHFQKLGLEFDAVYSGFLGSERQISVVSDYLCAYPDALHLIDPVMGDNGEIYKTYTEKMCRDMRSLADKADIITPNLTEAAILLDKNYNADITEREIKKQVIDLSMGGNCSVVITGVVRDGTTSNFCFDRDTGEEFSVSGNVTGADYPGTGDIFASVLLGFLLKKQSLHFAVSEAAKFVSKCIDVTYAAGTPRRDGVLIENLLGELEKR